MIADYVMLGLVDEMKLLMLSPVYTIQPVVKPVVSFNGVFLGLVPDVKGTSPNVRQR